MKQIYCYMLMLAFFTGCSICDPDTDNSSEDVSRYIGTFRLTAWNVPVQVDIDQNGIGSRNLVTESACYVPSKIVLSADRNYVKHDHYPEMESDAGTCGATVSSGIWTVQGNKLTLVSSQGEEEVYDYGTVNSILTRSETNYRYPVMNGDNGAYAYGDVNMVFTKE
jgi:hypothetical protein